MIVNFFFQVLVTALLVLLVLSLLPGCINLEAPPLGFVMHCEVCEQVTAWVDAYPYFECSVSGTRW